MIVDGWVDFAERVDGHPEKQYAVENSGQWLTCHSVVGNLPGHAVPPRFMSDRRNADGSFVPEAQASVMFILYKDGHLTQCYPLTATTWTSGGPEANTRSFSIEAEGGQAPNYSEPLTPEATETFKRLFREVAAHQGWDTSRPLDYLKQHKDVAREFGYSPTSCASDRYANAWAELAREAQEDTMTTAEKEEMEALRKRRELAELAADLNRYEEMLATYHYARLQGFVP